MDRYVPQLRKGIDYTNTSEEQRKEERIYWEKMLSYLEDIKNNTSNLSNIVNLLVENNEKQDEIIDIIKELLSITALKGNPEEAMSLYQKVIDRINKLNNGADAFMKLMNFCTFVGGMLHQLGILQ